MSQNKESIWKEVTSGFGPVTSFVFLLLSTIQGNPIMGGPVSNHLGITESLSRDASKFFIYQQQWAEMLEGRKTRLVYFIYLFILSERLGTILQCSSDLFIHRTKWKGKLGFLSALASCYFSPFSCGQYLAFL